MAFVKYRKSNIRSPRWSYFSYGIDRAYLYYAEFVSTKARAIINSCVMKASGSIDAACYWAVAVTMYHVHIKRSILLKKKKEKKRKKYMTLI